MITPVSDYMTAAPEVREPGTPDFADAAHLMLELGIGTCPSSAAATWSGSCPSATSWTPRSTPADQSPEPDQIPSPAGP